MTQPDGLVIPGDLAYAAEREGRGAWLATLPETVERMATDWSIHVGEPFQPGGQTAWVAPATRDDEDLVVKVLWRHPEAEHEADALRAWDGDGAVQLHATAEVDSDTIALLLERCRPGTTVRARPELEQDLVVAGLLRRLWKQPPPAHPFRSLESMCDRWAEEFEHKTADGQSALDPGLEREGMALFRGLPASAEREVLLCTDLHAGNVLAAQREPWLVIDPKPYVGDPTYDVLQHMMNCSERLQAAPHDLAWRMADLAGLDRDRVLLWLFARCVQESADWPELAQVAHRIGPA